MEGKNPYDGGRWGKKKRGKKNFCTNIGAQNKAPAMQMGVCQGALTPYLTLCCLYSSMTINRICIQWLDTIFFSSNKSFLDLLWFFRVFGSPLWHAWFSLAFIYEFELSDSEKNIHFFGEKNPKFWVFKQKSSFWPIYRPDFRASLRVRCSLFCSRALMFCKLSLG